jgi:hypothetical protein
LKKTTCALDNPDLALARPCGLALVRGSASFQRGGVYAGRAVEAVGLVLE